MTPIQHLSQAVKRKKEMASSHRKKQPLNPEVQLSFRRLLQKTKQKQKKMLILKKGENLFLKGPVKSYGSSVFYFD